MAPNPRLSTLDVALLVEKIKNSKSILLTTHKQCDGDGLGAALSLYHALKKVGKHVRVMTVDEIPQKYHFLEVHKYVEIFESPHKAIADTDLALIFDTNDERLVEPLFSTLKQKCKDVLFVDHHPILNDGPKPTLGSFIDTSASSTGEIAYFLVKALGIRFDKLISRALYTSIVFDTQLFRFIRGSANSYLICAELLEFENNPGEIHKELFSTYTINKVQFLSEALGEIEYYSEGKVASLLIKKSQLDHFGLDVDDTRDVIDMIMNITSLQAAAVFREDQPGVFKLSLRSKGHFEILGVAESLQGGGHIYAAGALVKGDYPHVKQNVVDQLLQRIDKDCMNS